MLTESEVHILHELPNGWCWIDDARPAPSAAFYLRCMRHVRSQGFILAQRLRDDVIAKMPTARAAGQALTFQRVTGFISGIPLMSEQSADTALCDLNARERLIMFGTAAAISALDLQPVESPFHPDDPARRDLSLASLGR